MSTTESGESAAGRVTRSLRKRITSMDSDLSSRPGTPIVNSLLTISETVTPSKRITRRTSLSTPLTTPSKAAKVRLDSSEFSNSPARRSIRRRSVSIQDQEFPTPAKSKEPSVDVVKEEESTPKMKNRRVTRSSSKSPLELLTLQTKLDFTKPTPKNKSVEQDDIVINLDESTDEVASTSPAIISSKKHTKVMIKKEKNIDEMVQASPPKQSQPNREREKNTNTDKEKSVEKELTPSKPPTEQKSPQMDSIKKLRVSIERGSSAEPEVDGMSPKKSESAQNQSRKNDGESSPIKELAKPEKETLKEHAKIKTNEGVEVLDSAKKKSNLGLEKKDLSTFIRSSPVKAQPEADDIQKKPKPRPENLKNVAFDETADEDAIKAVFPKTPGLTKSKSYILDSSKDIENETSNKSTDDPRQSSITESENKFDKEHVDEDNEVLSTKTPYKLKLEAVESSTPIQNVSPRKNKSAVLEEGKEESAKENGEAEEVGSFPKSWSQSVSGTVTEKAKIDSIKSEESMRKQLEEEEALKKTQSFTSQDRSIKKKGVFDDYCDEDDDLLEEDDDYDEELEEEEERNRKRSIFVDEEAMEVPEGEESMDSEERQYLEENEVPVYGESIGSDDSEDENYQEEAEEEDDGFIVSDNEDVLHSADKPDSNDEFEEVEQERKKRKIYKRIIKCSESSNEGDNPAKVECRDLKLNLDSSAEEETTEKKTLSSFRDNQEKQEKNNTEQDTLNKLNEDETSKEKKSQKNKEDEDKVDNAVEKEDTPNRRKSPKHEDDQIEDTGETSKANTKNKRMSLKDFKEDEEEGTPNRRKSLKNKEESVKDDKLGDMSSSNKRKSLQKTEEQGNETKVDGDKKEVSKKTRKKSLNMVDEDTDTEARELSERKRKSLNSSKSNRTPQVKVSNVEMEEEERMMLSNIGSDDDAERQVVSSSKSSKNSRKSLNSSKSGVSRDDDDLKNHNEELNRSIKSPYRKSMGDEHHPENEYTAASSKRKSINTSLHDNEEKRENTAISSKKAFRKSFKTSDNESEEHQNSGSLKEDLNTSRKSSRKSLKNNVESDEDENAESTKARKLIIKLNKNFNVKNLGDMSRKSLDNSKTDKSTTDNEEAEGSRKKNLNMSIKSLNDSKNKKRKSLARTSTEEANDEEQQSLQYKSPNRSKLEKSFQAFEDDYEQEETLSASEGRSLNSSRRSRKSLNQSKLSIDNYENKNFSEEQDYEPEPEEIHSYRDISLRADTNSEDENSSQDANDYDENEARFSEPEGDEHHKIEAEKTMMDFLGEEDESKPTALNSSRRRSINKSKLDETFELESKGNSVPTHNNLHRSVLRKSFNQSQLQRESIKENRSATELEEDGENYSDNSVDSLEEIDIEVGQEIVLERALSVSLSNIESKKEKIKSDEKAIRNSFTIGVSVRKSPFVDGPPQSPPSDSNESECDNQVFSEQEDLENVKNVHHAGPYKARKSLSTSLKTTPLNSDETKDKKRIKRTSLYLQEQDASQSFVENIVEKNKKATSKRKRKSNSFCGVMAPSVENEVEQQIPKSERKQNQFPEPEDKSDIQRILSRCEEILDAANLAKREAKINAKKSKVKKPKWMDKEEKADKKEDEVKIPLVSNKELKRKEKIKKELTKALKHSTAMLKTIDPKLGKKLKATQVTKTKQMENDYSSSKRLPTEILEALKEAPLPKKKTSKEIETTPPSDKENSKKNRSKGAHTVNNRPDDKKKGALEILETASGTVIVEPSTPKKLRIQHGFRESPKTPVGFKIQNINSAGMKDKSRKHAKKLFTASGEFVEEDLCVSNAKASSKREKTHKRKRHIEEPIYSLPKTQWTTSGLFVEEDLYSTRPLANSTATQFVVTSLNGSKKVKKSTSVVSSATLNSALSFKQSALFSDKARRETSRDLIHRKQRELANNQY